jgi:hypothetical protein
MPEKEAKSRCTGSRLSYFWKAGRASRNRNPRDASPRTCRGKRLIGDSITSLPFSQRSHRPLAHCRRFRAYDFKVCMIASKSSGARVGKDSIEGFQFRCINTMIKNLNSVLAPKLTARADGIESARYDFERFLWLLSFSERK